MYLMESRMERKEIPVMYTRYDRKGFISTAEVKANNAYWKYKKPDGTFAGIIADNQKHPMDITDLLVRMEVPDNLHTISLDFSTTPRSLTARYWPARYAGIREAYEIMYENLKVSENSLTLPKGEQGYIVQIHAIWPQGYADYEFFLFPASVSHRP
jgi:hypothetical protein